jgi:hypothetical protein
LGLQLIRQRDVTDNNTAILQTGSISYLNVLASNYIVTQESTASGSATDLTTLDEVTVNVAATTTVFVEYTAVIQKTGGASGTPFNVVNIEV